jgi:RimJ/RimL family protein N-acetyltransferase
LVLQLGDIAVRHLVREDAEAIARHADNPLVAEVLRDRFPSPYSRDHARSFIRAVIDSDPPMAYAIANEQEAFGVVGFLPGQDVYYRSAEVGFWIGEEYWGRGIMSRVLQAFSEYLFLNFEFNRLYCGIFSSNPASARVLEKSGYQREGILKAHITKNGEVLDEWLYARIRPGL